MSKSIFVVKTNPVEGREDEYNDWYNNQHLPDVLSVPGFTSAERFVLTDLERNAGATHRYLALYHIQGDPLEALAALSEAAPDFVRSEAMMAGSESFLYTPVEGGSLIAADD